MADQPLREGQFFGLRDTQLGADCRLERFQLVIGKSHEKGFQQDNRFPETGIQVVVSGVHRLPFQIEIHRGALGNVGGGSTKIVIEIIHHLAEGADLIKKLRAFGEQDAAEQAVEKRRTLAPDTLEIGGVERRGVGYRAVMFGVLAERPKKRDQRVSEAVTEIGCDADCQAGFRQAPPLTQRERLIQGNAQHIVGDF